MLKLVPPKGQSSESDCAVNLLPCRIRHDGSVHATKRYWSPTISDDGKMEAYFRGRKLEGKEIKIPDDFKGVIVRETGIEKSVAVQPREEISLQGDEPQEEAEQIRLLEQVGSFKDVVFWGHESTVDGEDAFIKGLGEWIGFSKAMHETGGTGA